jgi:hypothetical protein
MRSSSEEFPVFKEGVNAGLSKRPKKMYTTASGITIN